VTGINRIQLADGRQGMKTRMKIERQGLSADWERKITRTAYIITAVVTGISILLALALMRAGISAWILIPLLVLALNLVYAGLTRKIRRRRAILSRPFPADWEAILQREVVFFRALSPEDRKRFRRELQLFLGEKRITGIKLELDTTTRVLTAASAIIPIFGFPEWEWDQISEVLVYPDRFDHDFQFESGSRRHTLGMVGTGSLNRLMILSQPDLLAGFRNPRDKRNVGFHEFAHLVDKSDGTIDGLPSVGLDRESIGPWIDLVRRKMKEMDRGKSDINRYGLTNEAEFFAVATEYFFERPDVMARKHPELYAMLSRVFNQSLKDRAVAMAKEIKRGRRRLGRNSPCPCGSGKKYKKCCLKS
jgi:Mlc titration factor MtfA (ptsG expression regulator)